FLNVTPRMLWSRNSAGVPPPASTVVTRSALFDVCRRDPNYRGSMVEHRRTQGFREWMAADARDWIAVPGPGDDKYSRGVLGVITGSHRYPGAAVIGVDAALHTGVGMLRYLGPAPDLVLARRPEAVTAEGRVDAWLLGS